jgi:formylglycine-generating enzyme required for sulfatase activity
MKKRLLFACSILIASIAFIACEEQPNDNSNENGNGNTVANGVNFNMVKVEGGTFTMGATSEQGENTYDNEKPTHQVTLSDFSISSTEVTQALWKAVMGGWPDTEYNPDYTFDFEGDDKTYSYGKGDNYPMYFVSWEDIVGTDASSIGYTINEITYYKNGFCYKLSELVGDGKQFRLPTEAEWEYAARGGNKATTQTKYSGSNNIDEVAWYWKDDNNDYENDNGCGSHEVGKKKANALGLYDMSGNVWEWCSDWLGEYSSNAQTNPTGPTDGSYHRVLRGDHWHDGVGDCRVSYRNGTHPSYIDCFIGFRLAF